MAAAVTCYPTSPRAITDSCVISCTGADSNTSTGYDTDNYPASPQVVYRFRARKTGSDDLLSEPFSTNSSGAHQWNGIAFPSAGSWTVTLRNTDGDSQVATLAVTVQ